MKPSYKKIFLVLNVCAIQNVFAWSGIGGAPYQSVDKNFSRKSVALGNTYSNLVIQAKDRNLVKDNQLEQANSISIASQQWDIIPLDEGGRYGPLFKIKNSNSNLVLGVNANSFDLELAEDSPRRIGQRWYIRKNPNKKNAYVLENYALRDAMPNDNILGLLSCTKAAGTKISFVAQQSDCTEWAIGGSSSVTSLDSKDPATPIYLINKGSVVLSNAYSNKMMVPLESKEDSIILQDTLNYNKEQGWDITPISGKTRNGNQLYKISFAGSQLAMDTSKQGNSIKITPNFNQNSPQYQWLIYDNHDGTYSFQNMAGPKKFLDLAACKESAGVGIKLSYPDHTACGIYSDSFKWTIKPSRRSVTQNFSGNNIAIRSVYNGKFLDGGGWVRLINSTYAGHPNNLDYRPVGPLLSDMERGWDIGWDIQYANKNSGNEPLFFISTIPNKDHGTFYLNIKGKRRNDGHELHDRRIDLSRNITDRSYWKIYQNSTGTYSFQNMYNSQPYNDEKYFLDYINCEYSDLTLYGINPSQSTCNIGTYDKTPYGLSQQWQIVPLN